MAKLIPPVIDPDTKSPGERELFTRLKQDPGCDSWTVLHSLNLAEHVRQLQGEVDFVIVIPELGILCLEVKAHHEVRVEEGVWMFGRQRKRGRSPFRQASEAMHSVRKQLLNHPGLGGIVCWSAVLFTHTAFSQTSPEWHSWQAIGTRQYHSRPVSDLLAGVLKNAHAFLRERRLGWYKADVRRPTEDECATITHLLRPSFEVLETPRERAKRLEGEVRRYTEEQYAALDAMTANRRVIFTGPAGTGKTVLALEAAKRAVAQGQRVLFLCFNQLLGRHLKEQCETLRPSVTTTTLHAYMRRIADVAVPENAPASFWQQELPMLAAESLLLKDDERHLYDEIIVDEAQDILRENYLDILDLSLRGGLAAGQWRFFGDFEQQAIYKANTQDDDMTLETFQVTRSGGAALFSLRINCRNTPQISTLVELIAQLEPGYSRVLRQGGDLEPRLHSFSSQPEQLQLLTNELAQLYEEGYRGDDIVVISVLRDTDAAAAQLTASPWRQRLVPLATRPAGHIGYSSVHAYKGLEAPVIILTDVSHVRDKDAAAILYVGLTRALHRLIVLLNDRAKKDVLELFTR